MTLHVALTHRTAYHYDRVIGMAPQVIRLRPAPHCRTPILSYSLTLEPDPHFINWQQDPFANYCARVVLPEKCERFVVTVDLVADMAVINPFDFFVEDQAKDWPFAYAPELKKELQSYLEPLPAGPRLAGFLEGMSGMRGGTIDFLCDLNRKLHAEVSYCIRMEPGIQTPEETLQKGSGSCRDFRLAAGADPAPHRLRSALRVGLSHPIASRRKAGGWPCGRGCRFHRLARLGRGLRSRRRLDRARSDVGSPGRRGAHPARRHSQSIERGTDQRRP